MSSDVTTQEMVEAYLNQEIRDDIFTNLVASHLSQMCLFGIRQGVEFYPAYDPAKERSKLIKRLINESKLPLYMRSIWEKCLATGSILFYLRPTKDFYELRWFDRNQFEIIYDKDNATMETVIITYPYTEKGGIGNLQITRWVRVTITPDWIRQGTFDHDPSLNIEATPLLDSSTAFPGEVTVENTLGLIPCVVVDNDPSAPGERGQSDFDWLSPQIEQLNRAKGAIGANIEFFGNPTLITTRPASQVVESANLGSEQYRGVSTGSGFQNPRQGIRSTRKYDYSRMRHRLDRLRVKKVIGSVEPDERIGYILPDPISGDQTNQINREEEMIRSALGGVAEFSFSAGATAFEIKSLYGKAAATARRKAEGIYTHGLCKIFELMIAAEEFIFLQSFKLATDWDNKEAKKRGPLTEDALRSYVFGEEEGKGKGLPDGLIGIFPQGNRTINWRWVGPVFEDSPQDKQQLSILMRNLTEEGIDTLEAFKVIYPDKSDEELNAMLGGVPFRRAQRIIQIIQMLVPLHQGMAAAPLVSNPGVPMVMAYGPEIEKSLAILFTKLTEELSRGQENYEPAISELTTYGFPAEFSATADALQSGGQYAGGSAELPGATGSAGLFGPGNFGSGPNVPTSPAPAGLSQQRSSVSSADNPYGPTSVSPFAAAGLYPGNGAGYVPEPASGTVPAAGSAPAGPTAALPLQPFDAVQLGQFGSGMEGSIRETNQPAVYSGLGQQFRRPEFTVPLIAPGATVRSGVSRPQPAPGNASGPIPGQYGSADLQRQPGLLARLFPTFAAAIPTPARKR
jgi:hypothetical protein